VNTWPPSEASVLKSGAVAPTGNAARAHDRQAAASTIDQRVIPSLHGRGNTKRRVSDRIAAVFVVVIFFVMMGNPWIAVVRPRRVGAKMGANV
jgi:hypothetical protein